MNADRVDIAALKAAMREQSEATDGYLWPAPLQEDFLAAMAAGNPGGICLKYTRWGCSIHNLYHVPFHLFKMSVLTTYTGVPFEQLQRWHDADIEAGLWTDGSYPLPSPPPN
ncbi:MAG: hypothetical protein KJ077_11065 [Anaerolineae bacterium]|nr:hypothetical protein [Anaerolineae bacterium]